MKKIIAALVLALVLGNGPAHGQETAINTDGNSASNATGEEKAQQPELKLNKGLEARLEARLTRQLEALVVEARMAGLGPDNEVEYVREELAVARLTQQQFSESDLHLLETILRSVAIDTEERVEYAREQVAKARLRGRLTAIEVEVTEDLLQGLTIEANNREETSDSKPPKQQSKAGDSERVVPGGDRGSARMQVKSEAHAEALLSVRLLELELEGEVFEEELWKKTRLLVRRIEGELELLKEVEELNANLLIEKRDRGLIRLLMEEQIRWYGLEQEGEMLKQEALKLLAKAQPVAALSPR